MRNIKIFAMVTVTLLPLILLRDFTPVNELRYLSIADEALRNGCFFTFSNHGIPYPEKPPLYFWCIMFGKLLLGKHCMWFLSLFSLIPAYVIVWIMDKWSEREGFGRERLTAMLMLLSCGLFTGMMIMLRMDMLMAMFITLALYTFYKIYKGFGNQIINSILFPVFIFLAIFSKGPIGLLIPLISTVAYLLILKQGKTIIKYWGWKTWSILFILCSLWFISVYIEGGYAYLDNLLFHQTIGRAYHSFHHAQPFFYYLLVMWYAYAPWIFLIIELIVKGIKRKMIRNDCDKFFIVIAISTFILLSIISSKIEVYLLPSFAFFVYASLPLLVNMKDDKWIKLMIAIPAILFVFAIPILNIIGHFINEISLFFYMDAAFLTITGIVTLYRLYARKETLRAINFMAIGLLISIFCGGFGITNINKYLGYGDLCKEALSMSKEYHLNNYYTWKLRRAENMDVYLNKQIIRLDDNEASYKKELKIKNKSLCINHNKFAISGILMVPTAELVNLPTEIRRQPLKIVGSCTAIVIR
jgi:4-amino-4-deoxy-L-arabinose transferase-like glycosyltransferase